MTEIQREQLVDSINSKNVIAESISLKKDKEQRLNDIISNRK